MSKDYKFLCFEELEVKTKTRLFAVKNKNFGQLLGYVKWYAPWRRYCFFTKNFNTNTAMVFDVGCLTDISDFINSLMAERKIPKEKKS